MQYLVGFFHEGVVDSTIVERDELSDAIVLDVERKLAEVHGVTRVFSMLPLALATISLGDAVKIAQAVEKRVSEGETSIFRAVIDEISRHQGLAHHPPEAQR